MCTLFANLYVLLTWGPHMVYKGTPYIFDIYMIRCGWLGSDPYSRRPSAKFLATPRNDPSWLLFSSLPPLLIHIVDVFNYKLANALKSNR